MLAIPRMEASSKEALKATQERSGVTVSQTHVTQVRTAPFTRSTSLSSPQNSIHPHFAAGRVPNCGVSGKPTAPKGHGRPSRIASCQAYGSGERTTAMDAVREGAVAQAVTRPDGSIDLNATTHFDSAPAAASLHRRLYDMAPRPTHGRPWSDCAGLRGQKRRGGHRRPQPSG